MRRSARSTAKTAARNNRLQFTGNDRGDLFQAFLIVRVEAIQIGAIDIEHAEQWRKFPTCFLRSDRKLETCATNQRHDDFGSRGSIARDVAGKLIHVGDAQRGACLRRRPANAAAERDPHARGPPLNGPTTSSPSFNK